MGKKESKSLKSLMKGSVDSIKSTVKNVKIPDVKLPDVKLSDIKIPDVKIPPVADLFKKKETDTEEQKPLKVISISTRNALKIIYYLMAVDGELFNNEKEKFELLGQELTPDFQDIKDELINECQKQMEKIIDQEDYYDVLQEGVEEALLSSIKTEDSFITPNLLVWDLLTLAHSDNNYDESERRLIKYVVRKLDVDKAVFLEMESSILTLLDLEKELEWIKTTDRPYLTIEAMVNEIEDRKHVIFESIKDLISLG